MQTNANRMLFEQHEGSAKLTHPSNDRNQQPIADKLLTLLDGQTAGLQLLEIASGSGQQVGFFAPLFPHISFQTTEYDRELFASISAYAQDCPSRNIKAPVHVDLTLEPEEWEVPLPAGSFDYIYNCNTVHATPWECCIGLFRAVSKLLKPTGKLIVYGPYAEDGELAPESNVAWDRRMRSINPAFGIRDITELKKVALVHGMQLQEVMEMPANNKLLIWTKQQ